MIRSKVASAKASILPPGLSPAQDNGTLGISSARVSGRPGASASLAKSRVRFCTIPFARSRRPPNMDHPAEIEPAAQTSQRGTIGDQKMPLLIEHRGAVRSWI